MIASLLVEYPHPAFQFQLYLYDTVKCKRFYVQSWSIKSKAFSLAPEWWARYQVVSYKLESRGGTRDEFIDMVQRCDAVGVNIIVDGILNHATGMDQTGE